MQIQARIASDPTRAGALPVAPAGGLERATGGGGRLRYAQRIQWRFCVERLCRAAGLRLRFTEQRCLNFQLTTAADPLACRFNPDTAWRVPPFLRQRSRPALRPLDGIHGQGRAHRARRRKSGYGRSPRFTYAVGVSNGGYQVRRAIEPAPEVFDGGVDWEGTFVDEHAPNVLTDLPPAILNFPDYRASGFNRDQHGGEEHSRRRLSSGYRLPRRASFWASHWDSFWEVTLCQWQKRLDPSYDTYGSGTGTYNYAAGFLSRTSVSSWLLSPTRAGPAASGHRGRHYGCVAADRPSRARVRAQGRQRLEALEAR